MQKHGRFLWILLGVPALLVCIATGAFALAPARPSAIDDAFILLVYVKHLAEHGVIAWNLGSEHVDGCTSMLDLLIKVAICRVTGLDPFAVSFRVTVDMVYL